MNAAARPVRLFRNGRNQAVRIPVEFELPGNSATIRREGSSLVIEPVDTLLAWLASLPGLDVDFPEIIDLPPEPEDVF